MLTSSSPYLSANNGTVDASGVITSAQTLKDGTHTIAYFKTGSEDIEEGEISVSEGKTTQSQFFDSVFSVTRKTNSENIYIVEQLTFSQEGTVDIVASEHQCEEVDGKPVSKLATLIAKVDEELEDD